MWPLTLWQKLLLGVAALVWLLLDLAWLFSDASVGHELDGLLLNLALVGLPTLAIALLIGALRRR